MTKLTGAKNSGRKYSGAELGTGSRELETTGVGRLYRKLLSEFGPQGWWPTIQSPVSSLRSPVLGKPHTAPGSQLIYHPGDYSFPKTEQQRFGIVAGALLTQNTSWKNAEKALLNLHSAGKLSPGKIISLPLPELETLIRPSGYFRQKAERLKSLSEAYLEADGDADTETLREHFLSVGGVGPETADSILLYAYKRPVFVVDAYTRRICSSLRLFHGKGYEDYRLFFESSLPRKHEIFNEFHALIVEWGKRNPDKRI
ncbi:MAG: endonuclease III domain-containing protein [Candidatus Micrarchaeota archaeon]